MSLPENLGRLSSALTSDASLNIGVGVTPSGSFKLEVSTTSKFTGVATFGSTLSNGTYSYTLPSATGTLALTSAIPANPVGGTGTTNYLPKFTATTTIGDSLFYDNGTLTAVGNRVSTNSFVGLVRNFNVLGTDAAVRVARYTDSYATLHPTVEMLNYSDDGVYRRFYWDNFVNGSDSYGIRQRLTGGGPTTNGTVIDQTRLTIFSGGNVGINTTTDAGYKLDVNGTVNLSGALSGTSATFSGTNANIQLGATAAIATSDNLRHIFAGIGAFIGQDANGEANIGNNIYYSTGFKRRVTGFASNVRFNDGNIYLQVAASGAADSAITWTNALTIASTGEATFSSSVTTGATSTLKATGNSFTNGSLILKNSDGTTNTYLTNAGGGFYLSNNGTTANLSILSTGEATFSSSIAAGSDISANAGSSLRVYRPDSSYPSASWFWNINMSSGNLLGFAVNGGTSKMVIDISGNVGIGVTPSAWASAFKALQVGTASLSQNNNTTAYIGSNWVSESGGDKYITTNAAAVYAQNSGEHIWYTAPSGTAGNTVTFTERMRILSGGNVLINCTSVPSSSVSGFVINGASSGNISSSGSSTGAYNHFLFYNGNGLVGYIQTSGYTTTYGTSSDYRLKKDVQPITDALARIQLLNPVKYKWKCDDSDGEGFIAHELQEIIPSSVIGEKDGEEMQGVDYSKIVPILVKAIQEQQAQIEALKLLIK